MIRHCCGSSVRMAVKDVASFLANDFKLQVEKDSFYLPEGHGWKAAQSGTSIC
jgi:hypothetical protein